MPHLSQIRLLQHKPAISRRVILQNRVYHSISSNQESFASNIYNCYERLGNVDWLSYSPFLGDFKNAALPMSMKENLCMQSASLNLSVYPSLVTSVIEYYRNSNHDEFQLPPFSSSISSRKTSKSLRIGWISGDICYHPVSRLCCSLFNGTIPNNHSHTVIDIFPHDDESNAAHFDALKHVSFVDLGYSSLPIKISSA